MDQTLWFGGKCTSVIQAADRKAVCLVVVVSDHVLDVVVEGPAPPVRHIVLRRRPEEGIVGKIAETATAVGGATRKSRKTTAVGSACIGRFPMC